MIIRENQKKTISHPYSPTAILNLSGSTIIVGTLSESQGDCNFIMTDECEEPCFMNPDEVKLLIAALQTSLGENQ